MVARVQTVVFVQAFGSSGRAWAPQVAGLGERDRVIAPDPPGHGGAAGPFTLDRAVEAVRAVIADAGGDLRDRLGEVAVPTLVACGARDRANLGPSREIAAGVPGAVLRIVPDAVHLWNLQ